MSRRLCMVFALLSAALSVTSLLKSIVYTRLSHQNVIVPSRHIPERHRYIDNLYEEVDERIDNMQAQPIQVRSDYRTPCWYENLTAVDPYPITSHLYLRFFNDNIIVQRSYRSSFAKSIAVFKRRLKNGLGKRRLRCLPFFYLIGINRGGSTGLWTSLMSHPHVLGSDAAKELHYWNEIRYGAGLEKMGYGRYLALIRNDTIPRPLKSYVDLFDSAAENIRKTYIVDQHGRRFHPIVLGEGSPNYLTDFGNWQMLPANKGFTEPKYTVANILKMLTPRVHIVVSLRDPITRLISEYTTYQRHENKTEEEFHRLASDAINLMKLCLTNRTLRSCVYDIDLASQTQPVILVHSLYYPFIKDWLVVFTRKQMIILRSEDFYEDPKKVANEVFTFFGLVAIKKVKIGGRNARPSQRRHFVPYTKTLDMLRNFFKPYNKQLASYLGSNKFLWNK